MTVHIHQVGEVKQMTPSRKHQQGDSMTPCRRR